MSFKVKNLIAVAVPLIIFFLPVSFFPIEGLTIVEKRVIGIFFLAAFFWVLEPIPIYATSVLIILLELILVSDKSFVLFLEGKENVVAFGTLLSYKDIMSTFASPIIMLFLGGFFLALSATKYRLDQNLARVLLKPFGENPKMVMMGLMVITAIFSMFMSNTATTAMMLSILAPVLMVFKESDPGKTAFALAIPVAANIGGIATPIGTPPNAIALQYLTGEDTISFGQWMSFGLPYVIILLFFSWFLLGFLFPVETEKIQLNIKGKFLKTQKAIIVYLTFSTTIFLWLFDFLHGMNSYIVALIPVAVFSATGIINKEDLKTLSWDVLWLVSGGIALGSALDKSGLAKNVVGSIPFETFPALLLILFVATLGLIMANFMSNTATANLLLPIIAALGTSMTSLDDFGGGKMLVLCLTFSVSLGMALPISTPPNALAHATGLIQVPQMSKVGVTVGVIGVLLTFVMLYVLKIVQFI
ncbi:MAG: DASS family sodium-coupled anion symporter [Bacteroidota bacterium]